MITVITGMPGNGKTLYAVWLLQKAATENAKLRKAGKPERPLYSDIEGLTIEGVQVPPDDWRETPDGSLLVYDEAHERFPSPQRSTRSGVSENPIVNAMAKHRHTGHDLVFITQWPNKLDPELRTLSGEHIHLNRAMGLQKAGLVRFARVQLNPYNAAARKTADEEIWSYPKELYDLYQSSTLHTAAYKFKLPARIRNGCITAVMIGFVLWGLYAFLVPDVPEKEADPQANAATSVAGVAAGSSAAMSPTLQLSATPPSTGRYSDAEAPRTPRFAGYWLGTRCRIWDEDGYELDIPDGKCRQLVKNGLPVHLGEMRTGPGMVERPESAPVASPADLVRATAATAVASTGIGDESFRGQQARYGQMRTASIPADYEGSQLH